MDTLLMSGKRVSVVMPCYNSERYAADSVRSVLSQTHKNLELLICDDDSTDSSFSIIENLALYDSRIKILSNKYGKGAPGARNTCLDHASSDYIAFLDSDDLRVKGKIEKQLDFMLKNDIEFSYSYNDVIDEDAHYICTHKCPEEVDAKKLRYANFIPCSTVIYKADLCAHIRQPNIRKDQNYLI